MHKYEKSATTLCAILTSGKTSYFPDVYHRKSDSPHFSEKNEILPTLLSQSVHIGNFLTFSTRTIIIKKQFCGSRNFFALLDMFYRFRNFFLLPKF